jgi:hypothetical protein
VTVLFDWGVSRSHLGFGVCVCDEVFDFVDG